MNIFSPTWLTTCLTAWLRGWRDRRTNQRYLRVRLRQARRLAAGQQQQCARMRLHWLSAEQRVNQLARENEQQRQTIHLQRQRLVELGTQRPCGVCPPLQFVPWPVDAKQQQPLVNGKLWLRFFVKVNDTHVWVSLVASGRAPLLHFLDRLEGRPSTPVSSS
jgi:hypothetical protein